MHRFLRHSLFVLTALTTSLAHAGNITAVSSITTPTLDGTSVTKTNWLADNFTTGSNLSLLTVASITIAFHSSSGTGGYFVDIYTDTSGHPGSLLAALTGSSNPNTTANYTYTPVSTLTLDPSTNYWLVEGTTTSTVQYQPMYITTNTPFTGHGWSITGDYVYSTNSGSSWGSLHTDGPTQYQIDVNFVPEPETYAIWAGILSIGAVLVVRRRPSVAV